MILIFCGPTIIVVVFEFLKINFFINLIYFISDNNIPFEEHIKNTFFLFTINILIALIISFIGKNLLMI